MESILENIGIITANKKDRLLQILIKNKTEFSQNPGKLKEYINKIVTTKHVPFKCTPCPTQYEVGDKVYQALIDLENKDIIEHTARLYSLPIVTTKTANQNVSRRATRIRTVSRATGSC